MVKTPRILGQNASNSVQRFRYDGYGGYQPEGSDAAAGLTFVDLSLTKPSIEPLTEPTSVYRNASLLNGKPAVDIAGQMANKPRVPSTFEIYRRIVRTLL